MDIEAEVRTSLDAMYNSFRFAPQSVLEYESVREWIYDGQYGDSNSIRNYLYEILWYTVLDPRPDSVMIDYAAMRLAYEDFADWPAGEREGVYQAILACWRFALTRLPPAETPEGTTISWRESTAGCFLTLADELNIVDGPFVATLFEARTEAAFYHQCQFVLRYCETFLQTDHPWQAFLPSRTDLAEMLAAGFFEFPQLEELASYAESLIHPWPLGWPNR